MLSQNNLDVDFSNNLVEILNLITDTLGVPTRLYNKNMKGIYCSSLSYMFCDKFCTLDTPCKHQLFLNGESNRKTPHTYVTKCRYAMNLHIIPICNSNKEIQAFSIFGPYSKSNEYKKNLPLSEIAESNNFDPIQLNQMVFEIPVLNTLDIKKANLMFNKLNSKFISLSKPRKQMPITSNLDENSLLRKIKMEEIAANISSHFLKTPFKDFDTEIERALHIVGDFAKSDRCFFAKLSNDYEKIELFYSWKKTDTMRHIDAGDLFPNHPDSYTLSQITSGTKIEYNKNSALSFYTESKHWDNFGIKSLIIVPLSSYKKTNSCIGLSSSAFEIDPYKDHDNMLKLVGNVILNALTRRKAEAAKMLSEENFRNLFESSPDPIIVVDKMLSIVDFNKSARDSFCTQAHNSLSGSKLESIFAHTIKSASLLIKLFENAPERIEHELINDKGENKAFEITTAIINFNKKKSLLLNMHDISARVKAQNEVLQWKNNYELAMAFSDQVIYEMDLVGDKMLWGESLTKVLGYSRTELGGSKSVFESLIHPADVRTVLNLLKISLKNFKTFSAEFRFKHKKGHYIWLKNHAFIQYNDNLDAVRMLGLVQNISERKTAEDEIRKLIEDLNNSRVLLEDYSNDMAELNYHLENAADELRSLNASKDKLFSIIAHDLKNPIGTFKNVLKLVNENYDDMDTYEIKDFIKEMNESAKQLFKLLENLLQWSKAQTGQIKCKPTTFDIDFIISNSIKNHLGNAAKKNIEIISERNGVNNVYADPALLSFVIDILISNALKYSFQNSKVLIKHESCTNDFLNLSVIDYGVGISDDIQAKLFKIDEHCSIPGTAQEKGTGLGLIIAKDFIEKNSGSISFNSVPGSHTVFNISIPKR